MRVAVTGTPGTGKTTATRLLEPRLGTETEAGDAETGHLDAESETLDVVHLNEVLEEEGLYTDVDADRNSKIADLEALERWLEGRENVVIESHLAHHFDVDRVAVLRCAPAVLESRLRERGDSEAKAIENAESEALDVILAEAVEKQGLESVYEIDTTGREPAQVAEELCLVIREKREPSAGEVDFVGYLS